VQQRSDKAIKSEWTKQYVHHDGCIKHMKITRVKKKSQKKEIFQNQKCKIVILKSTEISEMYVFFNKV